MQSTPLISLSDLLHSAQGHSGTLSLTVPADWMQGRAVFGGLQVALAQQAMRALVPTMPLRTLQTTFMAPPTNNIVSVQARILRSGKNTVHVEARMSEGETLLAIVIGVFGNARASTVVVMPKQLPVDAAAPIQMPFLPGVVPNFTQHFNAVWLRGQLPFTGDTQCQHVIEVGMKEQGLATEAHVIAIADFIPPIGLSHLHTVGAGSTLTWMLEFLRDQFAVALSGWRIDAELKMAKDGYTSQSVMIWGPDGQAMAVSQQSMVVFG